MKRLYLAAAVLCLLAAFGPSATAETTFVFTPADGTDPRGVAARAERAERVRASVEARKLETDERPSIAGRGVSADRYILPYYFVDSNSMGETTLLAIRSSASGVGTATIRYYGLSLSSGAVRTDSVDLDPQEVYTRNLRDIPELPVIPILGGALGFVLIDFPSADLDLGADYFRINIGQNFATGSMMAKAQDLCFIRENRFLEGGPIDGGTEIVLLMDNPQGGDPGTDDPSAVMEVFSEDGTLVGTVSVYTDSNVAALPFESFTFGELFGAIETEFIGGVGYTTVTYSAANKYSIGITGRCLPTPL